MSFAVGAGSADLRLGATTPVRAYLGAALVFGTAPPPPAYDYTVATLAAARALDPAVGESVYVTELEGSPNGAVWDVVDESTVTGYRVIDGQSVLALDADVSDVGPVGTTPAGLASLTLGADVLFGSLLITGNGAAPAFGPDHLVDADLHGRVWNWTSSRETPLFHHDTGTFEERYGDLQGAGTVLGTALTVTAKRLTGPRLLVRRGFTAFVPSESPAHTAGPAVTGDEASRNMGVLNWMRLLARDHPTVDEVRHTETTYARGLWRYGHGVHEHGLGATPAVMLPDAVAWEGLEVGKKEVGVYGSSALNCWVNVGLRPSRNDTAVHLHDFCVDMNARGNMAVWDDPSAYDHYSGYKVTTFQNAPRGVPLWMGWADAPPANGDPDDSHVYFYGTVTFKDSFGHLCGNGSAGPQADWHWDTGAVLRLESPGFDDNHHGSYGMDVPDEAGGPPHVRAAGRATNYMGFQGRRAGTVTWEYVDPEPEGDEVNGFTAIAVRDTQTLAAPLRVELGPLGADLPALCRELVNANSLPTPAAIDSFSLGGTVVSANDALTVLGGGPWTGTVGAASAGSPLRVEVPTQSKVSILGNGSFPLDFGGDIEARNIVVANQDAGSSPSDQGQSHAGFRSTENLSGTVKLTGLVSVARPGAVMTFKPRASGAGLDVVYDAACDLRGEADGPVRQAANHTRTGASDAELGRLRFIALPGATVPTVRPDNDVPASYCFERVFRGRDVTDRVGRPSDAVGTYTATGSEGTTFFIPTNLLWGAREVSVVAQGGAPAVTAAVCVQASGTSPYAVDSGLDWRGARLMVTVASAPSAGQEYAYTARVTPEAEWSMYRPHLVAPLPALPTLAPASGGGTAAFDAAPFFEHRDADGNAGPGVTGYEATTTNGSVATASVAGSTVTVTGGSAGSCSLYVDAYDAAGTRTRLTVPVTVA